MASPFRVNVADLLRHKGARRPVHLASPISGLVIGETRVPTRDPIVAELTLESVSDGILAMGHVNGHWVAECSRCLQPIDTWFDLELRELFESNPLDEETYPIDGETIDLEPAVRDVVLVELPIAPVCDVECLGLCVECGVNRNEIDCGHTGEVDDPRWSGLAALQFDSPEIQES
jgi:uncharacterized protein